ncbi:WD40 repeat domain-containing protein [Phytohabitans rumicis]|uniref:Uncharacterized protein n=1 Tax=Phytohabitans rumicis TaxID=1076125 RepID=A0A6V8KSU6_9ACTN|nr:hypothetical protein [Phytohabitans rumicis]GFJ86500.1 hypothetical protein Prum_001420 [Phytohabitans rumicis]
MDPSAAARERAGAYLRAGEELSQLQLAARRAGADQLADRFAYDGGLPWTARWLLPVEETHHRTLAALRGPVVALWTVRGIVGAVAASGEYGVWDLDSGDPLAHGHGAVEVGATTVTGRHVLAATDETGLRLWEAVDGAPVERDRVAVVLRPRSLRAVTPRDGDPLLVGVEQTVYVDDWTMMDSTTTAGGVRAWAIAGDPPRLRECQPPPLPHPPRVDARYPAVSVLAHAETCLLTGGLDGVLRAWEPAGRPDPPPVPVASPTAAACATRSDGRRIAVVTHDNRRVGAWDLVEGAPPPDALHDAHYAVGVACVRAPGGPLLAVTAGLDGRMCVFDVDTGALLRTVVMPVADPLPGTGSYRPPGVPAPEPGPEPVRAVAATVLPDGRAVAVTVGDLGWLRWWCPLTGAALGAVRLSQGGRAVACGRRPVLAVTTGHVLRVYDVTTAQPTAAIPVSGPHALSALAILDDLVVALDDTGRLHRYRLPDGAPVGDPLHGHYRDARTVACGRHPDGRAIAVSGGFDGTVRVWDLDAGTRLHRIPMEHPVYAVALADDGAILVGMQSAIGVLRLHPAVRSGR